MIRGLCGALPLAMLVASISAAQPAASQLPRVAMELFPASARDAVAQAYRDAEAKPTDAQAAGTLARVLQAWEQWNAAHEAYLRAQALAPRAFEWHYLDAVVLQRLARHKEAAERLRVAVTLSPDYAPARVKLAESLFEAGAPGESRSVYEALAREPASEPMGQFGSGRVAASEGRHDEALEHLRRAVALFPQWGAAHYALALSYRALGRRDEARHELELQAQYGPQWPALDDPLIATVSAVRDDGRALLSRGLKLAGAGDLQGAIEAHETALVRDPALVQAHLNLISLYGRSQQWAKAEAHYRAVIATATDVGDAHYDYGVLLGLQQRWDEAIDAYRRAIATNPHHARAHNNLGEALERERDMDSALDEYRQAVTREPGFRLARFNVARMLIAAGKTDEAIVELQKIVEPADAEAPRYQFGLAVAYARAGQKDEAIKWATEAHRLALDHGQPELAAAIERDRAKLK
ncbi:MAG TPA: tetratricopeptide repeat protein [Vicinamibacterales bacterium]|nr:tetratricopeptide repeat protein [Vicinamibacterales bacterium]